MQVKFGSDTGRANGPGQVLLVVLMGQARLSWGISRAGIALERGRACAERDWAYLGPTPTI